MVSQPQRTTTRLGYILTDSGLKRLNDAKMGTTHEDIGGLANPKRDRGTVGKIFNQGKEVKKGKTIRSGSDEASIRAVFAALKVTPAPEKGFDYTLYQSSDVGAPKILISASSQHRLYASQLIEAVNDELDNEKVVWVTGDLSRNSEQPHQQLGFYDCFLFLKSSDSAVELLDEEINLLRQLQRREKDKKFTVAVIHIESALCLPLNHPLNSKLQGIHQWEWNPRGTNEASRIRNLVLSELSSQPASSEQSQSANDWLASLQNTSPLSDLRNWLLTYVGESPLQKLDELVKNIKNYRRIPSGYSYWGLGPALMWNKACTHPYSHMSENIHEFTQYANPLFSHIDKQSFNFVSLGVGEGSKDDHIISDFFCQSETNQPRVDFLYIPVDMSLEMIRLAIRKIHRLLPTNRIAIQRDIESPGSMAEIASIAKTLGQQRPILYSFVGNTISNVESPGDVLGNIAAIMHDNDLLLFEARIVHPSALEPENLEKTLNSVIEDYKDGAFRDFALSALLQWTDLSMNTEKREQFYTVSSFVGDYAAEKIIEVHCSFKNTSVNPITIRLSTDETVLQPEECIRLYRSRKFTPDSLGNLVRNSGFEVVGEPRCHWGVHQTGFTVMLLRRSQQSLTSSRLG